MSHHHFTPIERGKIEELNRLGYSSRKIAARLGRHHSSIDRDLKRSAIKGSYTASIAQYDYDARRKGKRKTSQLPCDIH